jgi:alpha-N-acetylglucosamine transferase
VKHIFFMCMCVLISLVLFVFIDFYIEIEEYQKVACSIGHHFATLYVHVAM